MTTTRHDSASLADLVAAYRAADCEVAVISRQAERLDDAMRGQLGQRPFGRNRQSALWDARRLNLSEELGVAAVEATLSAAIKEAQRLRTAIARTPAASPADLALKGEVVESWCDPDPLLASLLADARRLASAA